MALAMEGPDREASAGEILKASAASGPAFLRIRDVVKRFGVFTALAGVSLDVAEGEFVCFLGPSGCGKTTLLRAIAGLDVQSEGRIEQGGRDISNLPIAARDFGIVFQSYALFPNLNVTANIGYGLQARRLSAAKIQARVDALLDLVGLPEAARKFPAQLSGGQQQRVALARALAPEPGLLLLDEPLSALDARVRLHLRQEIKSLQRRLGITTIMVTHDQEEALAIADRIVVMNQGRIEQVGTPLEIYRRPASRFVAGFVGTMNFLEGVVTGPNRVRLGGVDLPFSHDLAVGAGLTLAIRPESVELLPPAPDQENGPDLVLAVEAVEFLGAFLRVALTGERGLAVKADVPLGRVAELFPEPGRRLAVRLPAAAFSLYPA